MPGTVKSPAPRGRVGSTPTSGTIRRPRGKGLPRVEIRPPDPERPAAEERGGDLESPGPGEVEAEILHEFCRHGARQRRRRRDEQRCGRRKRRAQKEGAAKETGAQ